MKGRVLTLKITDPANELQPDTLPAGRLAEIVRLYEAAVLAALPSRDADDAPAVSLTSVADGCVCLQATHGPSAAEAGALLKDALSRGDYSRVPTRAQERLAELSHLMVANDYTATLSGLTAGHAEISASRPVPVPRKVRVQNKTTIYGECVRVGGEKPKAAIRLFATGKQLDVTVSPDLAKELGQKLYDYVGIEGTAVYDLASDEIVSFHGTALTPYAGKAASPVGALKRLAALSGATWKGVNPDEYTRQLRDEE